jgi:hypothetical protein
VRQKQVPQAGGTGLGFELFDQFGGDPGIALGAVLGDFAEKARFVRVDVLVHELEQARPQFLYFGGVVEVHEISRRGGAML